LPIKFQKSISQIEGYFGYPDVHQGSCRGKLQTSTLASHKG